MSEQQDDAAPISGRTLDGIELLSEAPFAAERDLVLYRGLVRAEHQYPVDNAHELIVRVAKAIEKYRSRNRRWPKSLDDLRPGLMLEAPVDPWGRVLRYAAKPDSGYVLLTYGADGVSGGKLQDKDFYLEDGAFVDRPSIFP